MSIIASLADFSGVDRISNHPKLAFVADKRPPSRIVYPELLIAAEPAGNIFDNRLTSPHITIYHPSRGDEVKPGA